MSLELIINQANLKLKSDRQWSNDKATIEAIREEMVKNEDQGQSYIQLSCNNTISGRTELIFIDDVNQIY